MGRPWCTRTSRKQNIVTLPFSRPKIWIGSPSPLKEFCPEFILLFTTALDLLVRLRQTRPFQDERAMMVLVDVVKGTAKTTTARALDELLGWTFQDVKM